MKLAKPLCAAWLLVCCATLAHAQLRIGQPSGFTGSVAAGVQENTDGAWLYLESVNKHGGVHGQPVELVSMDDQFDPAKTV